MVSAEHENGALAAAPAAAAPLPCLRGNNSIDEYGDLKRFFGKRWGYFLLPAILEMELDYYPTRADAEADGHSFPRNYPRDLVDIRISVRFSCAEMEQEHHRERRLRIRRGLFARCISPRGQAERGAEP